MLIWTPSRPICLATSKEEGSALPRFHSQAPILNQRERGAANNGAMREAAKPQGRRLHAAGKECTPGIVSRRLSSRLLGRLAGLRVPLLRRSVYTPPAAIASADRAGRGRAGQGSAGHLPGLIDARAAVL